MDVFKKMLAEWWEQNAKAVKDEIEDRTGQRPTATNQVAARMRGFEEGGEELEYAVLVFNGQPVAFITVDWGEPLLKICYAV